MRRKGENETFIKCVICEGILWRLELRVLAVEEVVSECRGDFGVGVTQVEWVY